MHFANICEGDSPIKVKSTTTLELYTRKPNCVSQTANPSQGSVQYQRKDKGSPSFSKGHAFPLHPHTLVAFRAEVGSWGGRPDLDTAVPRA